MRTRHTAASSVRTVTVAAGWEAKCVVPCLLCPESTIRCVFCTQDPEAEHAVTDSAGIFPQLAAAMARSGALQTVLAEARRLERSGNAYAVSMLCRLCTTSLGTSL